MKASNFDHSEIDRCFIFNEPRSNLMSKKDSKNNKMAYFYTKSYSINHNVLALAFWYALHPFYSLGSLHGHV